MKNQTSEHSGSPPQSRQRTWQREWRSCGGETLCATRALLNHHRQNKRTAANDEQRPHEGSRLKNLVLNTNVAAAADARLFDLEKRSVITLRRLQMTFPCLRLCARVGATSSPRSQQGWRRGLCIIHENKAVQPSCSQ